MTDMRWHRGAVHEAGHAVMARLLGLEIGPITIDLADPLGDAHAALWWTLETMTPENRIRVAAAGDACVRLFGIVTLHEQGAINDEIEIGNALDEMCEDETQHRQLRLDAIAEVERRLAEPRARAAAEALVRQLVARGGMTGERAQSIIDAHLGKAPPARA
jgi:hypothetical protein